MTAPALAISQDALLELIAGHVAATLSPERVEQLAEAEISRRIGMLTLEQAQRHLQCRSPRQLTDFCRENGIPIEHFGAKKRFIRLADIERAQERAKRFLPTPNAPTGITISRTA